MGTWGKRSAPLALFTAGFLTLGSGVASADISIGEVNVPAEGVNVSVGSNSSGNSGSQKAASTKSQKSSSSSSSSSSGSSSGGSSSGPVTTQQAPLQAPQQEGGGVLSGNSVNVPVDVPLEVCGNAFGVLGSASGSCGEAPVPTPPGPNGPPPTPVPPPDDEAPSQPRPVPPGAEEPGEAAEAAEELPVTGTNAGSLAALAGVLLAAGAACIAATSRRIRMGRR